ncbi:MAG TPA: NAD(P)H-dependent oxidoreductase [Solirubrobacteraceae bacterium]|nr:NAD(P)H-dependent oxidoreductase [Solirubrobacteraceae bacterium]
MQVLGISGSLRRDSHNRRLLRAAAGLLSPDAEFVLFDGLKDIPPFDEDDEPAPGPAVSRWREVLAGADALLFATPEYNASIPGQLKNAVDWASRPIESAALRNKPAAVIGASTGIFGAVWAQAELRKALATAGARLIDRELPVAGADEAFDPDGALAEREQELELDSILTELLDEARGPEAPRQAAEGELARQV